MEVPLFPGYLFSPASNSGGDRFSLLTIRGVMHIVGVGSIPEPVNEKEILAIRHAVRSDAPIEPWPFLEGGQRIRLLSGPLAGLEGILVNTDAQLRVVLGLSALKRSVAVKVEAPVGVE